MNSREKLLVVGVGLLVLLWVSTKGVSNYRQACERNEKKLLDVQGDLTMARHADARGRRAQSRLSELGRLSLPTDTDIAVTLYETWLREQLGNSGLEVDDLSSKTGAGPHKRAQKIIFTVNAKGTLAELSSFLYGFYQAGHLHRISETSLMPEEGEDSLKITLAIEALSLDNCKREDSLTDRPSKAKLEPLEKIQVDIVSRDIFTVYNPPAATQTASTQLSIAEDAIAAQAFITSMTYGQGGWRMSVRMKDTGKIQFFREGDPIKFGSFAGNITKLDGRRAVVTIGNEQMQVRLGKSLSQAQPLADLAG
ncbi:MAG: hypothetical protein GXP26_10505 [Planctomycetes bacterium]|nr:hypothetical protein [Planctomycetota bacterium]